jgi:DNA-binding transcriptional LysR family regulator
MFDLSQLRCFVTVAEELHFGRAANRLNMTQPPLSRQIQVLERIVEAPLLDRTSRSVRLTPAGRSFLPEARRILKLAESASQVARRIALGKTGSIKIGFTATTAYGFVPDLIAACRTQLPEVDLSLKEMVSGDQLEALMSGQIDIGLLRPPIGRPEFASMLVGAERLLVAVPQGHALAARDSVMPWELDGHAFIMYSPHESRYFHDLVVTLFTRADTRPRYVQHLSQIHSILAMVCAGLGLAIVPEAAANLNFRGVELRPLQVSGPPPVETYLVWRRDDESPLLPPLIEIARGLASAPARLD